MSPFTKFISSFSFKLFVHIILAIILVLNVSNLLDIKNCENLNLSLISENNQLQRNIMQVNNQQAYQNSDLYKNKEIKSRNYIFSGEQVIDLSSYEKIIISDNSNYIPESNNKNKSNFEKWFNRIDSFKLAIVNKC